ncbi:MAG: hypothetical protein OXG81_13030 [Acidobacteria bacterium]|nr:hypothetical protein [Acidobacteriota bacterium]
MDGVIVGGWGWVVAAYGSAGAALILYTYSLFARRRRTSGNTPAQEQSDEHGTHDTDEGTGT